MKAVKTTFKALAITSLVSLSVNSYAAPIGYDIEDTYIGGYDNKNGVSRNADVIGDPSWFDIHGMNVDITGQQVTVDIYTNFASLDSIGRFGSANDGTSNLTNTNYAAGRGIGLGDLFLSNEYTPYGTDAGHKYDSSNNGTKWTYGIAINDPWLQFTQADDQLVYSGNALLVELNGATNNDNALLSNDFLSGGRYRKGQEVAIDPSTIMSGLNTPLSNTATWSVDTRNNIVSFSFDATGTNLLGADQDLLALHWAMHCGNDTIEGYVNTPTQVSEPGTIALLGLGLLGLGAARRRQS